MKIVFATANKSKVKEMNLLISGELLGLSDVGITEDIPETQPTLEGNALQKARYVFDRTGLPVFADDTGLEVEALDGAPGVYSARYAGEEKNPQANIEKLLQELNGQENRAARFRTVIAYIDADTEMTFDGIVEGRITEAARGTEGFGYDPVFVPEDEARTFAEMTLAEKNLRSHRARAMEKFLDWLGKNRGEK